MPRRLSGYWRGRLLNWVLLVLGWVHACFFSGKTNLSDSLARGFHAVKRHPIRNAFDLRSETGTNTRLSVEIHHAQLGGNVDTALETARHRAELRMKPVYPLRRLPLLRCHFQRVRGVNPLNDQYIAVFLDLSFHFG